MRFRTRWGIRSAIQENQNGTAIYTGQDWDTKVEGLENDYLTARGIELDEGRTFTEAEQQAGANVCIIGPTVVEEMFLPGDDR